MHQGTKATKRDKRETARETRWSVKADVALLAAKSTKPGRQNGTQARWQPRTNDSSEGKTEQDRPGEGSVVVSLLGWNYHAGIDPVRILPMTWTCWLGKFKTLCLLRKLSGCKDMVESPAFRGACENPCELVSLTFGSLFCWLGLAEMNENLWELAHLPNDASRRWVVRFQGISYRRLLFRKFRNIDKRHFRQP